MRSLSNHLRELEIDGACTPVDEQMSCCAYRNICSLGRLHSLKVNSPDLHGSRALMDFISHLTSLRQLGVYEPQGRQLIVPEEITRLHDLAEVGMGDVASCNALLHLPAIRTLWLNIVYEPLIVPTELPCATCLTSLTLSELHLAGHVQELSALCNLSKLSLEAVGTSHEVPLDTLNKTLGCLTSLMELHLVNMLIAIQLEDLAGLCKLEVLAVIRCQLEHAVCSSNWQRLRSLDLRSNCLSSLPVGRSNLSNLHDLDVSNQGPHAHSTFQLQDSLLDCFALPNLQSVCLSQGLAQEWSPGSVSCMAKAMTKAGFCDMEFEF